MIETERLRILPLNLDQLKKYLRPDQTLESELRLNPSPREISPDLVEAFGTSVLPNVADPDKNYLYYTLWTVVSKSEHTIVAGLLFTGEPGADGETEIGYGTEPPHRNKGYMTEAIGGIIGWAQTQKELRAIIAQTDAANRPSHAALIKNDFKPFKTVDDKIWWRRPTV